MIDNVLREMTVQFDCQMYMTTKTESHFSLNEMYPLEQFAWNDLKNKHGSVQHVLFICLK